MTIVSAVERILVRGKELEGKTVIVTAGGTQEPIDPVRYIGNRSSGKMGYALADEARRRGARVILISAPTLLPPPVHLELIQVQTAEEMRQAVLSYYPQADAVIKAAAVADFRPSQEALSKIERTEGKISLELKANPDILAELGSKKERQILVGFALESENLIERAKEKLKKKNLDLVIVNNPTHIGADSSQVTLIFKDGRIEEFPLMSKAEVARIVIDRLAVLLLREA